MNKHEAGIEFTNNYTVHFCDAISGEFLCFSKQRNSATQLGISLNDLDDHGLQLTHSVLKAMRQLKAAHVHVDDELETQEHLNGMRTTEIVEDINFRSHG